ESYAGGEYGALGNLVSGVGRKAITSGYSRDYEREADVVGLRLLVEAGYDPHEAPKLFMHLKEHLEEENIDEPFFFGSHPKVKERIDSYNEQIAAHYPETTGKVGKEDYEKHLYGILMANIPLEMKKGRYEVVLRSAKRCLELRPDAAVPYRYIGIINMKFDYDKEALDAFNTYLLRNPNAKDKQEIKDYIKKVKAR
ncbi:MAG: M48 family metalloprotease, partial [Deltaproteobacteria bacterium]|nr:M48 family metalloprotease [Deltaproteobacteria bacterium]